MKIEKITRKQWAVAFLILSIPLVWWGYVNFMYKGSNSAVMAMAISLCLTSGICCVVGGIYMLFTKEKGRGEGLLVSQTTVKDSPIQKEIINKKQKVNEMAEAKDTVANTVKEVRELEGNIVQSEEIIKKETLNVKTTTEKIAVLKHNLAKDKTVKELLAIITD